MKTLLTVLGAVALVVILALLFAFPTMWLWNWLMPTIFGLIKISVWQAWGINALCGMLFKGSYSTNKSN